MIKCRNPESQKTKFKKLERVRMTGVTGSDVTPLKIVLVLLLVLVLSFRELSRKRKRTMAEELTPLPVTPAHDSGDYRVQTAGRFFLH
jgi:hypothetical protein